MNDFSVEHLRLIEQYEILVVHENGWEEPLTILKLEVGPDEFYPARKRSIRIKVKPPLAIVKE